MLWFSKLFVSAPLKITLRTYVAIAHFELKSKYFIIPIDICAKHNVQFYVL